MTNDLVAIEDTNIIGILLSKRGIFIHMKSLNDLIDDITKFYDFMEINDMSFHRADISKSYFIHNDLMCTKEGNYVLKIPIGMGNSIYLRKKIRLNRRKVTEHDSYAEMLKIMDSKHSCFEKYISFREYHGFGHSVFDIEPDTPRILASFAYQMVKFIDKIDDQNFKTTQYLMYRDGEIYLY